MEKKAITLFSSWQSRSRVDGPAPARNERCGSGAPDPAIEGRQPDKIVALSAPAYPRSNPSMKGFGGRVNPPLSFKLDFGGRLIVLQGVPNGQ